MRAAEKLIAENGIENVSIRDLVAAAGQKNESVLQYHFKNLQGLVAAIKTSRNSEIQERRSELLEELMEQTPNPALRQICRVMVRPAFELARSKADFRRYVKAFGHEISLAEASALSVAHRKGDQSSQETGVLLRGAMTYLDTDAYRRRIDGALRYVSASMYHQARQKNAFQGARGELFYSSLIDGLVGLLSAPESDETSAIANSLSEP